MFGDNTHEIEVIYKNPSAPSYQPVLYHSALAPCKILTAPYAKYCALHEVKVKALVGKVPMTAKSYISAGGDTCAFKICVAKKLKASDYQEYTVTIATYDPVLMASVEVIRRGGGVGYSTYCILR